MVLESKIDSFLCDIRLGVDFFFSAGQKLVEMLEEDPRAFDEILERSNLPWITVDVLKGFEMIGRKQLAVQAMFLPKHVLTRMVGMPLAEQERLIDNPVAVASGLRQGRHNVVHKRLTDLTRDESRRVIGPDGPRTVEQQAEVAAAKTTEQSLGKFCVFIVNGKPFIRRSDWPRAHVKVEVGKDNSVEIELVKRV